MDEQVDIIDENGNVLRQALKTDAHKHGWLPDNYTYRWSDM